jgi:hypothetical protein
MGRSLEIARLSFSGASKYVSNGAASEGHPRCRRAPLNTWGSKKKGPEDLPRGAPAPFPGAKPSESQ